MFCPNCGKQISDNSKFCGFCGAVMTPPAAPVVEQPVAAPVETASVAEQPVETAPIVEQPAASPVEPVPVTEQPVAAPVEPVPATEQPIATPVVEQPVATPVTEQPTMAAPMQPQPQQQMYQQPVYQQPMAAPMQQPPQGNMSPFSPVPPVEEKNKKKGKAGLIVAIVVLLLALAGGGVFVFMRMNSPAKKIAAAFAANDIDTVVELYEKVGDKEMDEVVSQAREYAENLTEGYLDGTGEQDYKSVSDTLSKLYGSVLNGDSKLAEWIYTVEVVDDSRSAFKLAESYKEAGNYVEALSEYAKVIKEDELNYAQAQQAIGETQNLYREAAIKEAKSYEESGNYEEARDVYEEALTVLEGDAQILSAIDDLGAAVVQQAFVEALEEADRAAGEGRYSDAIGIINDAMEIQGISSAQQQALTDKLSEITAEMYVDGTILGTWRMQCDLSEAIVSELGPDFEDLEAPFIVDMMFEFGEDGTFRLYVDEESFRENFNAWLDEVLAYAANIMYDMFEDMGLSKKEADELVQELYGMTMEEYLKESMMTEIDVEEMIEEILASVDINGIYRVEEDRLYMAEQEINENQYDIFHFEEDKLIIGLSDGADSSEILPGIAYPFELIREQ
ncbi:MAG: zinc-ribbon domain-containing protein [Lachnospiraceae bacterium]|nr:zinc-ribbon domain-containing protein [Lachnospiraceae bacterium]